MNTKVMGGFARFVHVLELFMVSMVISIINLNNLFTIDRFKKDKYNEFISHHDEKQKFDFVWNRYFREVVTSGINWQAMNFIVTFGVSLLWELYGI